MLDKLPDEIAQLILNAHEHTQELQPSFENHPDAFCFIQTAAGDWFKNIITGDVLKQIGPWKTVIFMTEEDWEYLGNGPVVKENYIKNPTPPRKKTTAHSTLAQAQAEMQDRATTTATSILEAGIEHMKARAVTYDSPNGERSMGKTVAAFNTITGHTLSVDQGWLLMVLLKAVRAQKDKTFDSLEDLVAYSALMGEAKAEILNEKTST